MSRIVQMQTNFAVGEIDPLLRARIDLKQYYSALETATNVVIQPQGGAKRREGLRYVMTLDSGAANAVRLVPFEFNTDDSYMFAVTPGKLYVFRGGALVTNINSTGNNYLAISEITAAMLPEIRFAQSADTIIFVHEDLPPIKLVRGADHDEWNKSTISFDFIPYFAFTVSTVAGTSLTTDSFDHLKPNATSGNIKVEAMKSGGSSESNVFTESAAYYEDQFINVTPFGRLRIVRKVDNHTLECVSEVPLFDTSDIPKASFDIERGYEEVWSGTRGWPKAVTFHEGRLWLAGSKALPSTVWASRVNDFFNFDKGEGLDDASLEATISTSTLNAITDIFSGRDLQIFTTGGEFYVPQANLEPVTPSNFIVKIATRNGSKSDVPVVGVDSGTLFIQREGKSLNELAFTDTELAYNTSNVSMLSGHLFKSPTDMAIRRATSTDESDRLMIVNDDDGSMIVFSLLRSQEVTAPAKFTTDGAFVAVGVDVDRIYAVVKRTVNSVNYYFVEYFDSAIHLDSAVQASGAASSAAANHLNTAVVKVILDGIVQADKTVSGNTVTFDRTSSTGYEVGLNYSVEIKTMPVEPQIQSGSLRGFKKRIIEVNAEVFETQAMTVNGQQVQFRQFGQNNLDSAVKKFTGIKTVGPLLGFNKEGQITITQSVPLDMTVLALDYKVSVGQ